MDYEVIERVLGLGPTARVLDAKRAMVGEKPSMSCARAMILTEAYRESEADPVVLRRAKGLARVLREIPIFISDHELCAGHVSVALRGAEVFPERHMDWVDDIESFETRGHNRLVIPKGTKEKLQSIYPYWRNRSVRHRLRAIRPEAVQNALDTSFIINPHEWNGLGHIAPDFELVLHRGLRGLRADIEAARAKTPLGDPEQPRKACFWDAAELLIDATADYARRHAELAERLAARTANEKRRRELEEMADICRRVPYEPARSFREALQAVWFTLLIPQIESNGFSITIGRLDQYMLPFLEADLRSGAITLEDAQEWLDMFFLHTCEPLRVDDDSFAWINAGYSVGQNLTIGGVDAHGRDCTNVLTYMCLQANTHVQLNQPNLSARLHQSAPQAYVSAIARAVSRGNGMPQLLNDEVIIPALLDKGIDLKLARDYIPVGCDEITVRRHWGRCNGGSLNFAKALELALHDGRCPLKGVQVGLRTGGLERFDTFEKLMDAFTAQLDYGVELLMNEANRTDWVHGQMDCLPFVSMLVGGCVDSGRDVTEGGAALNSTGVVGIATGSTADSLYAIQKTVYEDHRFTLEQLVAMTDANFEGCELQRQYLIGRVAKYGNDVDAVDALAVRVTDRWFDDLERYRSYFGGRVWGALYSVSTQVGAGNNMGALPDGRLAGMPLSDGITPMYGRDVNGPTAALKSVSKIDVFRSPNGCIVNQRLNPDVFRTEAGYRALESLIRSFVDLRSFHWQFNCIDTQTLRKAQQDPDAYRDVVVRVAGYSAVFVELPPKTQESIIQRTAATL